MQTWNIVIICFLELYYLPKKKLMLIYYCVAAVIIIYYLIRHNVDMYIVSASGCFSMAGFKKVIEEKIKYNKNADIEYSSNSVFCSKGQGIIVPWNEVEKYMHCEIFEE